MLIPEGMLPVIIGVLLLVLVAGGIVVVMRRRQQQNPNDVSSRLSQFAGRAEEASQPKDSRAALKQIDSVVSKSKRGSQTARDLARADLKMTVTEFYIAKVGAALIGLIIGVGAFIGRVGWEALLLSGLVGFVLFSFAPNLYVSQTATTRVKKFNDQLGDTISMMANSIRSGYSFLQTLDLVGKEAPMPTAVEFQRVVREVSLGVSTEAALQNLLKRVPSEDLDLLITAVGIQMEVGGNLATILETIGHTIRERVRIKGEIDVLTAQGRISAYVITGLPVALAVIITVINPDYMSPIFTFGMPPDAWCCLPVAGIVMIVIGFFAIMKIVDIEV